MGADGRPVTSHRNAWLLISGEEAQFIRAFYCAIAGGHPKGALAGPQFFFGATYINAGKRFHSKTLQAEGIAMASAVASQVWGNLNNGLAFDAPESLSIDGGVPNILYPGYERPIAVWDTFNALDPFFPPAVP